MNGPVNPKAGLDLCRQMLGQTKVKKYVCPNTLRNWLRGFIKSGPSRSSDEVTHETVCTPMRKASALLANNVSLSQVTFVSGIFFLRHELIVEGDGPYLCGMPKEHM